MSNFEDKITLQYEKELVKNGIDFDDPKDVQYLYNWAKNKEKECDSLKEDIEGLVDVLKMALGGINALLVFSGKPPSKNELVKVIKSELKKHKQS